MYVAHMSNATEWTATAIRRALFDSSRTKKAIADETGIPYPTLNRKIAGKRDFTLSELLSIAEATGTHPAAFIPPQFRLKAATADGACALGAAPAPPVSAAGTPTVQQLLDHEQVCDSCWSLEDAARHTAGIPIGRPAASAVGDGEIA